MRAFASGCTAMTGVEAVSNGVPLFRSPSAWPDRPADFDLHHRDPRGAARGNSLSRQRLRHRRDGPVQVGYQSNTLKFSSRRSSGRGAFYYVTMASIVAVLALSANTSFRGFPEALPHTRRTATCPARSCARTALSSPQGIITLASSRRASHRLPAASPSRLIPPSPSARSWLHAVQAGMVVHWRREAEPRRGPPADQRRRRRGHRGSRSSWSRLQVRRGRVAHF